jgi:ADP-heptose:LPS heptosyltransferase
MKILIIQGRGLGDAIISLGFIERLPGGHTIELLTSYHNNAIFKNYKTYPIVFPVNRSIFLYIKNSFKYLCLIVKLNFNNYDLIIDPVGGNQEIFFLSFIFAKKKISARSFTCNPLNLLFGRYHDDSIMSYYNFLDFFFYAIFGQLRNLYKINSKGQYFTIGISPFGGHDSRCLSIDQLYYLISSIPKRYKIIIYVENKDRTRIHDFLNCNKFFNCVVKSLPINELLIDLTFLDSIIATDSFLSHAAYYCSVKLYFINSLSDQRIWSPPGSFVIDYISPPCFSKPCFGKLVCMNTSFQYSCMSGVPLDRLIYFLRRDIDEHLGS